MARMLILSNGHGEDTIAGRILDQLWRRGVSPDAVHAWPMVGEGRAYAVRNIARLGPSNVLPSDGFGTTSWPKFWRDVRAGWFGLHARQARAALQLRGRYDLAVAVGDIVPMAAAVLARVPFFFVGCNRSAYYGRGHGYWGVETLLLRRHAVVVFPRDQRTARLLEADGLRVRFVGNPMMDGLDVSGAPLGVRVGDTVVAVLPGSRHDAVRNAAMAARAAAACAGRLRDAATLRFLCAAADDVDGVALQAALADTGLWEPEPVPADLPGVVCASTHATGARWLAFKGRFADILTRATVAIGLAGTANEQAVGLGCPVVTFPTDGATDAAYLRMKMPYFGESAVAVARAPEEVAAAIVGLLHDPGRRARMAAAGRERMGGPGASAAIAEAVVDWVRLHDATP